VKDLYIYCRCCRSS